MILDSSPASQIPASDPPWPPTVHVRSVLRRVRRRLHAAPRQERPSLRDPWSYLGLFHAGELTYLAKCGYWPLPARALAWVGEPPADRARRQRKWRRRVEAVVRELVAAELPEAVALLMGRAGQ
jgi:hypothetical protein